jgi:hypothetical protein
MGARLCLCLPSSLRVCQVLRVCQAPILHHHRFADALSQLGVKFEADVQQAVLAFLLQHSCPVLHLRERARASDSEGVSARHILIQFYPEIGAPVAKAVKLQECVCEHTRTRTSALYSSILTRRWVHQKPRQWNCAGRFFCAGLACPYFSANSSRILKRSSKVSCTGLM